MQTKIILKNFINNRNKRQLIVWLIVKLIGEKSYLKIWYYLTTGKKLNLDNPQTFDEKMQWTKLNYRKSLVTQCADKYRVRSYIQKNGLSNILVPIYGVYKNTDDIDYSSLPNKFILKCNHISNGNVICFDKNNFNKKAVNKKLKNFLKLNGYYSSLEWCYKDISPLITCEKLLESEDEYGLKDINVFCFNGEPKFIMYNLDMCKENGEHGEGKRFICDVDFNELEIESALPPINKEAIKKPKEWEKILEYSKILSRPFPHVRVDFFVCDEKIYFAELTFYSAGGAVKLNPEKWQKLVGDWMKLEV